MTWDHNKELHLAMRALRAELNRIASQVDKQLKWFDKAIADWEQAERARPNEACDHGIIGPCDYCEMDQELDEHLSSPRPSQGDPNAQARPAENQLVVSVCVECGEPLSESRRHQCPLAEL
jgi:hypothetical protein